MYVSRGDLGNYVDALVDHSVPLLITSAGNIRPRSARKFYTTRPEGREDYQLIYIADGCAHFRFSEDGPDMVVEKGNMVLFWPGQYQHYKLYSAEYGEFYWVHFTGGSVEKLIVKNKIEPERIYTLRPECMQDLRQELGRLFREIMLRRPGFEQMAVSLLMSIFVRLGRGVVREDNKETDCDLRNRLEQSVAYIHSHYTENISIRTLAAMEYLSDSRYREVFRETFGMPPSEFIIWLRLSQACELLQVTDLSVAQVAERCGYQDPLYFSRLFYKKIGTSPQSYRKNSKGE